MVVNMLMLANAPDSHESGLTLVELIIVMTVIGILVGFSFAIVRSYQYSGRDAERASDAESTARAFEISYLRDATSAGPSYPDTVSATTTSGYSTLFKGQDLDMTRSPGQITGTSIVAATTNSESQTPTKDQYIYLPLTAAGALCTSSTTTPCVRFSLYYRIEDGNTIKIVESVHQQ